MSNKMLIDATHPEETRVVVLRGNRVEEFDFEAADRQQLRGNIYLAKVTRVEPSLQAAFVDYGGNRHGFLAFSEIHPDYYQIPHADRQALLREHAREDAAQAEREDSQAERGAARRARADNAAAQAQSEVEESADAADAEAEGADESFPATEAAAADVAPSESVTEPDESGEAGEELSEAAADAQAEPEENGDAGHEEDEKVESVGAEDALEEVPERRKPRPRQYKIQEVIKRRQVMLVQVVKEERGSKGAALTTFLSLAGRYSVLMPNTARGGGISRKITQATDRKRLKAIASELEVPDGMGVILRTAGANRTKSEVKRDFEYLLRLWENVRELTLKSSAPKLVYEEGSLIKRSIRDLYSREIDQVVVAGDDAYREAKDFMRMLMPSHARNVQLYKETTPIFARSTVEAQLDAMFSPQVTLKSGGYIVINQTEALVSIDVNSGRSTREHSIEDTALKTNLEASEEIARQLRLRDLAGLIVIDFIDMEEKRNNRAVERKLKDCLRADRARIQVGRISHFGLLEMSRQRIRTGVLESSTVSCSHCRGSGQVRSVSSLSLQILRALEEQLLKSSTHNLQVRTRPEVALYVLNQKRRHLAELEARFGVAIAISEEAPENGAGFLVERGSTVEDRAERSGAIAMADVHEEDEAAATSVADDDEKDTGGDEGRERKRRRRRRRGNGDDRPPRRADAEGASDEADEDAGDGAEDETGVTTEAQDGEAGARKRRRGRRGGKRRGRGRDSADTKRGEASGEDEQTAEASSAGAENAGVAPDIEAVAEEDSDHAPEVSAEETSAETAPVEETPAETRAGNGGDSEAHDEDAETVEAASEDAPAELQHDEVAAEQRADDDEPEDDRSSGETPPPQAEDDNRPKRSGWWNKRSSFF